MKKIIAVMLALTVVSAFADESVCSPTFELTNLNPEFGTSSVKVLQGKMETQNGRQLLISDAKDSISAGDEFSKQISWAKSKNCTYLSQISLARLGEIVQVNARLIEIGSGNYIYKKAYKANSPEDLFPIFGQIANQLQDPKFVAAETIYDVSNSDAKALTKKRATTYYSGSIGYSLYQKFGLYELGFGVLWDNRSFMGEGGFSYAWDDGRSDDILAMNIGLRVLKPISDKDFAPYFGGGIGFTALSRSNEEDYYYDRPESNYGLKIEAIAGYIIGRTSGLRFRSEVNANVITTKVDGHIPVGGGLRAVLEFN